MTPPPLQLSDRLALCEQVARLARARLPIPGELSRRLGNNFRLRKSAAVIDDRLLAGQSLEQALAGDKSRDARILAACIQAGEASGRLERTLEAWTGMHLANARATRSLQAALLYPLLLIAVTLLSLGYVIWTLIPAYEATYALFGRGLPFWLNWLAIVHEQFWWVILAIAILAVAPLIIWAIHKRHLDALGLPLDRAQRLRIQAVSAELASYMIAGSVPLARLVPLSVAATGAEPVHSAHAFARLQQHEMIEPLGREATLLIASLYAGIMEPSETSQHLGLLAKHLQHQADQVAQRQVRWLPMMIALVVGLLTILTYVFLIYLPWILLLKQIILPPSLEL